MNKHLFTLFVFLFSISLYAQNQQWDIQFTTLNSVNGTVNAIERDNNGNIFVGGNFTSAGSISANSIAMWNGTSWIALGSGINGTVNALDYNNGSLYVGGTFTLAGGVACSNLAKWDGSVWTAIGTGTNGSIYALRFWSPYLYVGGSFTMGLDVACNNVIRTDGTITENIDGGVNGPVYSLDVRNNLVVGGAFTLAGGSVAVSNIATWNSSSWTSLGTGLNDQVHAVKITNEGIFAGGDFTMAGAVNCLKIAVFDANMWKNLGSGFDNRVKTIEVVDSLVYAGGSFQHSGTNPVNYISRYKNEEWHALGDGTNADVNAIKLNDFDLFCGGNFLIAGLNPSLNFGRWASKPVVLSQPYFITICEQQNLSLWVEYWTNSSTSFVWKKDGVIIPSSNNDTIIVPNFSVTDEGTYVCELTNNYGTSYSYQIQVTINTLPDFNLVPSNTTVCQFDEINWQTSATSTLTMDYTWINNGTAIPFSNSTEFQILSAQNTHAGNYYIVAENACGYSQSSSFTLTVNSLPTVSIGGLLNNYCYTSPIDTVTYSPIGGTLTGNNLNGDIFTPYGLVGDHIISYTYTDINGCTNIASHTAHIYNPTPINISGYSSYYCLHASNDTLQASPASGWFGGAISDSIFSPNTLGEGDFDVSYYFIDGNGCLNADTVTLTVLEEVTFTYPNLITKFCENEPTYFIEVYPPNGIFTGTGIENSNFFNPALAGSGNHITTYTFVDPYGCSAIDEQLMTVVPVTAATIIGLPTQICNNAEIIDLTGTPTTGDFVGNGVSGATFNPITLSPGNTTITYYSIDSNGCKDTTEATINILQVDEVFFTGLTPFYCQNELPDTLVPDPTGGTFSGTGMNGNIFYPLNAGEGNHEITYTFNNANGCVSDASVTVTVAENPEIFCGSDFVLCKGDSVTITAVYDTNNQLFWNTGHATPTITVSPNQTSMIIASVYDLVCFNYDTVNITVHNLPLFTLGEDYNACNVANLAPSSSFPQYNWSTGQITHEISISQSGTYMVTVTNNNSCNNSDTIHVNVLPGPITNLGPDRNITNLESITFLVNTGNDHYLWSDNSSSNTLVFNGSDYGVGTHEVWIYSWNDNDCYDMDTVLVTVTEEIWVETYELSVPISIYPNPSNEIVFAEFPESLIPNQVTFYDATGKSIEIGNLNYKFNNNLATWDVSSLSSGLYLVNFYINNHKICKKFYVN